jgi:hypothetical protein
MTSLIRSDQQPPCSSWAEETILSDCLRDPSLIDRVGDIGRELQFPEFRDIWRAMLRAHRQGAVWSRFYSAVHDELERTVCKGAHDEAWYAKVRQEWDNGLDIDDPLSMWWSCEAKRLLSLLNSGSLLPGQFDYAVKLLHRCTEARLAVSRYVELANRAWRVPEETFDADEAHRSLPSSLATEYGMEIPV